MTTTAAETDVRLAHVSTVTFPAVAASLSDVRTFVRRTLVGHARVDDAVLCVSELAANAVEHAGGDGFRVLVRLRPDRVYVAVADEGGGCSVPHVADADGGALSGRGLALVSVLAREWGFVPTLSGGWHVWCVFPVSGAGC